MVLDRKNYKTSRVVLQ